jgi:Protein of unknown function (DUF3592)
MSMAAASLFSLVFIAIGGAMVSYAIRMTGRARQSLSWPSTEGEIAHSAVLYQTETTATTSNAGTYKADISYRYQVKGVNYSSSRISLLDFSSSAAGRAESIVRNYPDKSTVRVYYNPSDFSESVLEPGSTGGINLLYVLGGIFATFGLFILILSLTGHVHTSR